MRRVGGAGVVAVWEVWVFLDYREARAWCCSRWTAGVRRGRGWCRDGARWLCGTARVRGAESLRWRLVRVLLAWVRTCWRPLEVVSWRCREVFPAPRLACRLFGLSLACLPQSHTRTHSSNSLLLHLFQETLYSRHCYDLPFIAATSQWKATSCSTMSQNGWESTSREQDEQPDSQDKIFPGSNLFSLSIVLLSMPMLHSCYFLSFGFRKEHASHFILSLWKMPYCIAPIFPVSISQINRRYKRLAAPAVTHVMEGQGKCRQPRGTLSASLSPCFYSCSMVKFGCLCLRRQLILSTP